MGRFRQLSDEKIEAILAGVVPDDPELEPLAAFGGTLRALGAEFVDDDLAAHQVAMAAEVARLSAGAALTSEKRRAALDRSRSKRGVMGTTLRRRVAIAVAAAALLVVGTAGLAVAADGAAPGDALYGVDRALEKVGLGSGGATERLEEASSLVERGRVAVGLDHAANALSELKGSPEIEGAEAALHHAADQVSTLRVEDVEGYEATQEFRDQAASLLDLLASQLSSDGGVVGQEVAATAGQFAVIARDFAATIRADNATDRPDRAQVPEGVTPGPGGGGDSSPDLPDSARVPEDVTQGHS